MDVPQHFVVPERFTHHRPEYVRSLLIGYSFTLAGDEYRSGFGNRMSEIWVRDDGSGFWIVRLDTQGHGTQVFGGRPHYHKEWIRTKPQLDAFLSGKSEKAYVYADDGSCIGRQQEFAGDDKKTKQSHIPR